ncbi:MAG: hypothetical protein Q4F21_02740 [Lachnospiraceae bacterium]|nr:hypothetical protein [Lachnospiraceae bacterium]
MKQRKMARLWSVLLTLCMLVGLMVPTTVAAAGETAGESSLQLKKTAKLEADGTYTIDLEAYVTGKTTTTAYNVNVPCDIVMVLDLSGTMNLPMDAAAGYTVVTTPAGGYTYNNYGNSTYYYKDGNNYYKVFRFEYSNDTGHHYFLYYQKGNTFYYLNGNTSQTAQPTGKGPDDVIYTDTLYKAAATRLEILKTAATNFVNQVSENAAANNVDHRIALTSFANGNTTDEGEGNVAQFPEWENTGIYINGKLTPYSQNKAATSSDLTAVQYQSALVSASENAANLTNSINVMTAHGSTYANYGMELAKNVLDARTDKTFTYTGQDGIVTKSRKQIVVFFTDGYPGLGVDTANDVFYEGYYKNIDTANAVIAHADEIKADGATVYSIAALNGAKPEADYNFEETTTNGYKSYTSGIQAANAYLHYVSSDYQRAGDMITPDRTKPVNNGYYFAASNAADLNKIFETISGSIDSSTTTATLDGSAVMRDVISDQFKLPAEFDVSSNVEIKTAKYSGNNTWEVPESVSAGVTAEKRNYTNAEGKKVDIIDVTGFNYKKNFVADAAGSTPAQGEKLMVTIKGVLAKDDTRGIVYTNKTSSGIYTNGTANGTLVDAFNLPEVEISQKSYVLDYGKTVNDNVSSMIKAGATALALDHGFNKQDTTAYKKSANGTYGSAKLADSKVSFTPGKINWDGIDTYSILAKLAGNASAYEWSAVNYIPANSVYYEDDFAQIESNTDADVSIVYSGTWNTVGTTKTNSEQSNENTVYGQDASYAGEKAYSDASAKQGKSGAKATFNFTGTGVDIYSSTDNDACTVYAFLYDKDNNMVKYALCDNFGADGKYYTVPTVAFDGLEHGTYKVELLVSASQTNPEAVNYYLDGIRVYNPLGTVTDDGSVAGDAYKEAGELNAKFTEIRAMLLDGKANVDGEGMLYFDQIKNESGVESAEPTTYESVGPEHEAYLSNGNGIAFTMNNFTDESVYVGIKLVKADSTDATVQVTDGAGKKNLTIDSTADTYYQITPDSEGNVVIQNNSDAVISVTKVRTTSPTTNDIEFVSSQATTVAYLSSFSALSIVDESTGDTDDNEGGDVIIDDDNIGKPNGNNGNHNGNDKGNGNKKQMEFSETFNKVSKSLKKAGNK